LFNYLGNTISHEKELGHLRNAPTVKPEAVKAVVNSWWWAWRQPNHVEQHINVR